MGPVDWGGGFAVSQVMSSIWSNVSRVTSLQGHFASVKDVKDDTNGQIRSQKEQCETV